MTELPNVTIGVEDGIVVANLTGEIDLSNATDITDLPDDRFRALFEDLLVGLDLFAIFPAETFGRKLDRRERILDFMGDAPRDIGPG